MARRIVSNGQQPPSAGGTNGPSLGGSSSNGPSRKRKAVAAYTLPAFTLYDLQQAKVPGREGFERIRPALQARLAQLLNDARFDPASEAPEVSLCRVETIDGVPCSVNLNLLLGNLLDGIDQDLLEPTVRNAVYLRKLAPWIVAVQRAATQAKGAGVPRGFWAVVGEAGQTRGQGKLNYAACLRYRLESALLPSEYALRMHALAAGECCLAAHKCLEPKVVAALLTRPKMRAFLGCGGGAPTWIRFLREGGLEGGLVTLYQGSVYDAMRDAYPGGFDLRRPEGEHWHATVFQTCRSKPPEERAAIAVEVCRHLFTSAGHLAAILNEEERVPDPRFVADPRGFLQSKGYSCLRELWDEFDLEAYADMHMGRQPGRLVEVVFPWLFSESHMGAARLLVEDFSVKRIFYGRGEGAPAEIDVPRLRACFLRDAQRYVRAQGRRLPDNLAELATASWLQQHGYLTIHLPDGSPMTREKFLQLVDPASLFEEE
jgi:hypothetical protein